MIEVTKEEMIIIKLDGPQARKSLEALNRISAALDDLPNDKRTPLVNAGTIDQLLTLRLALERELL